MVKTLNIQKYRKLVNIKLDFDEKINLIAGSNGTCKSSLLYLISNSYKKMVQKNYSEEISQYLSIIDNINSQMNPKIESLTRGDKAYNDPAPEINGAILDVTYDDNTNLSFRKHNSPKNNRYSIKPKYIQGKSEALPEMPVIYLGLPRLYPFGEFEVNNSLPKSKINNGIRKILEKSLDNIDDSKITELLNEIKDFTDKIEMSKETIRIPKKLPSNVQDEINNLYKEFTNVEIQNENSFYSSMGSLKKRGDFNTNKEGIDSNTISAGEDNLYIILTALVSLKHLSEKFKENGIEQRSLLLIDELDATLHPYYQLRLLQLLNNYSEHYNIQFIGTTHSFSLLENALNYKNNILYLIDGENSVNVVPNITFEKIKMYLSEQLRSDISAKSKIPIFTEDPEARLFLECIFDYFLEIDPDFSHAYSRFYLVPSKIGSDSLKSIFKDTQLTSNFMRSFCILDGDQSNNLTNNIIALPGKDSPENFIFKYLKEIYNDDNNSYFEKFWSFNSPALELGFQKKVVHREILTAINNIEAEILQLQQNSETTKGKRRDLNKKIFNQYTDFFKILFEFWIRDPKNLDELTKFHKSLNVLFCKTAFSHGIDHSIWKIKPKTEVPVSQI